MKDFIEKSKKAVPGANISFGDSSTLKNHLIGTGIPKFDDLLGGGIPRGKFCLFVGPYGAGKTFLCQVIMANVQKKGGSCMLIDAERSFAKEWVERSGVDVSKLFVSQPISGEAALDTVLFGIEEGIDLIVIDSIAALVPAEEIEKSMAEFSIGIQARMLNKGLRKLYQKFTKRACELGPEHNSALIAINQLRAGIGGPLVSDSYPAGKGQQSFASIIVKIRRGPWHQEGKETGFEIVCKTEKNKITSPFRECNLPFRWTGVIDVLVGLIDLALNVGIITQKGSFFTYKGTQVQGKLALIKHIETKGLQKTLENEVRQKTKTSLV